MSNVIYSKEKLFELNALYISKLKRNPNYKLEDLYEEIDGISNDSVLEFKDIQGYDDLELVVRNKELQVSREQKSIIEELAEVSEEEMLEDLKDILPNLDTTPKEEIVEEVKPKVIELKNNIDVINVDKNMTTEQQLNSVQSQLAERKEKDENKIHLESKENIFSPKVEDIKPKETVVEKVEETNKELLDMFDDLDNLYKVDSSVGGVIKKNLLLGEDDIATKITEKIVLPISGYTAYVSGLTMMDRSIINNTARNMFDVHNKMFKLMYNHIVEMTPKKPSYEVWKKMTAFSDLKILYYGLYAATYGRVGSEYTITCDNPECGQDNKVSTDPEGIIQILDEDIKNKIYDINTKIKTFEDIAKLSELSVTKKIKLPKSNMIVELKRPSLQDYLDMVQKFPPEDKKYENLGEIYDFCMFTSKIYMVNVEQTKETGKLCVYDPFTTTEEFMRIYSTKINISEDQLLVDGVNEVISKYAINYEIPKFKCSHCEHELGPYSAEPSDLLFRRLSRRG